MLGTGSLIGFAAITDPERAKGFYVGVLGLGLVSEDPFAVVVDANGTMLRLQKVEMVVAPPYTTLGWAVPRLDTVVSELTHRGVTFERYSFLQQRADGIWDAPGGARVAWFKDPDGNLLSLTQFP